MLTTASITFSAMSAMPSGPRAEAGTEIRMVAAPRQTAAAQGRKRWLKAGIAPVMSILSPGKATKFELHSAPEPGNGASIGAEAILPIARPDYGEKQTPAFTTTLIPLVFSRTRGQRRTNQI